MVERERTPYEIIYYGVYLIFEVLSLRACSRAIEPFIKKEATWHYGSGARILGLFFAWNPSSISIELLRRDLIRKYGLKCRFKHIFNWLNLFWLHDQPKYQMFLKGVKEAMLS